MVKSSNIIQFLTASIQIHLSLPLFLIAPLTTVMLLFIISRLIGHHYTCPNHLNKLFLILFSIGVISNYILIHSFLLILSLNVFPLIHLNILISITLDFFYMFLLIPNILTHGALLVFYSSYTNLHSISWVLYNHIGILHFNHPAWLKWTTSSLFLPRWWMIDPKYRKWSLWVILFIANWYHTLIPSQQFAEVTFYSVHLSTSVLVLSLLPPDWYHISLANNMHQGVSSGTSLVNSFITSAKHILSANLWW